MSESPYAPPSTTEDARPKAIAAFKLYAASGAVLYLGLTLLVAELRPANTILLCLACLAVAIVHAVAASAPLAPWGWKLALATIALGMASCLIVFAVPLFFAWTKPLVRAAYRLPP